MGKLLTEQQIIAKYGKASDKPTYLVTIELPFKMRLAWDKNTYVTKLKCHKLIAERLNSALKEVLDYYGYDKLVELGIDLLGGCYNYRLMRGGTKLSRHSWGICLDLNPERNQLKWDDDKSLFDNPEYKPLLDIFHKYDFINLGEIINRDWMHFESII